jgi:HEXXH motif-containing protein
MTELPSGFTLLPGESGSYASALRKARLLQMRSLLLEEGSKQLRRGLTAALKSRPGDVLDAIGTPECSAPLRAAQTGLAPQDSMQTALATMLAQLGRIPEDMLFPWPLEQLADVRENKVIGFGEPATGFRIGPDGMEFRLRGGRYAALEELEEGGDTLRPFHKIPGHPCLFSLYDANPLSGQEGHPEKSGNKIDLGGKKVEQWIEALEEAFRLIREAIPGWWAESAIALQRIVPVGYSGDMHLSASYREALGVAYMSLHPEPLTMAEAIVHETQHSKLNTILWLDPLLENGEDQCASPVRPDQRPLLGVLLAAHAFVPVAALHLGLSEQGLLEHGSRLFLQRRRKEVLQSNRLSLDTLEEKALPTQVGGRILADLAALDAAIRSAAEDDEPEQGEAP